MTTTFNTPLDLEPLPAYRRDPEAISIISSAPSYTSDAPTYHSRRPSVPELEAPPAYPGIVIAAAPARPNNNSHATTNATTSTNTINNASTTSQSGRPRSPRQQEDPPRIGLPSQQYAPGFHARPVSNFDPHAYNVGAWSSITTSSRQLHAVARRRASSSATAILNSLSAVPPPLNNNITTLSSASSSPYSSSSLSSTNSSTAAVSSPEPLLPREDPDLVGEIAASRARNARLYRERCLRGEEGFRHEGRTWDFMLNQMNDWDERERSWRGFREQVGRTKLLGLGRRIGLRG